MPTLQGLMYRFVLVLLLAASCNADPPALTDYDTLDLPGQPNIVWIVAEDLSPYLAAYGDSTVQTPNLDRLSAEGVTFTNMYSVSGVCAPSRFSIATGVYTTSAAAQHMRTTMRPAYHEETGVPPYEAMPAPGVRFMSEVLRMHGYYATNNAKQDYQLQAPVTAWDESSNQAHWRNRPANTPFFSIFNIGVTHESQVWARTSDSLRVAADLDVPVPPYLPRTDLVLRDVRRVYSNLKLLDTRVGNILAQLEQDGLLESTIVVFYADHGGPLPRQKRQLYDSGLHVPLIIRFPGGQLGGTRDDQLVSFVDLAPTTFSLAGIALPDYLEGQAFLGPYRSNMERAYIHAAADRFDAEYDTKRAVRDQRYKYIRNLRPDRGYYLAVTYREQMATMQELLRLRDEGGLNEAQAQWFRTSKAKEELFDVWEDPHELRSLAADPAYAEKLDELRQELDRWMAQTNDAGTMDEMALLRQLWPNLEQPVTAAPVMSREGEAVTLSSDTDGASIGYQLLLDGESLGPTWQVYSGPIFLSERATLTAMAHRLGHAPSDTITFDPR